MSTERLIGHEHLGRGLLGHLLPFGRLHGTTARQLNLLQPEAIKLRVEQPLVHIYLILERRLVHIHMIAVIRQRFDLSAQQTRLLVLRLQRPVHAGASHVNALLQTLQLQRHLVLATPQLIQLLRIGIIELHINIKNINSKN